MPMIDAELLQRRARNLPSLPSTVFELNQALADDRTTVDKLQAILSKDPALSATLLRMANSALYAGVGTVTDLRGALMRLGSEAVGNLATGAAVIKTLRGGSQLDALRLWQHSVAVGLVAKAVCRMVKKFGDAETAFLAGLLHDIGKLALDTCFPEQYAPVLDRMTAGAHAVDAEREILGITHAEAGALLAERWRFPEPIVAVIRDHHAPAPDAFLANLIHLSDLLVRTRIPNSPADEHMVLSLAEEPSFAAVFGQVQGLDLERLTFGIDDELDHATSFVDMAFHT